MQAKFINKSEESVILKINNTVHMLLPLGEITIDSQPDNNIACSVGLEKESAKKDNKYFFSIESSYNCNCVLKEATFYVLCESTSVSDIIDLERVVAYSDNAKCTLCESSIKGLKFKKSLVRKLLLFYIFTGPFEYLTGLCVLFYIIGIILMFVLGWKIAIIYGLFAQLFLVLLNWIINKVSAIMFNHAFDFKDEKHELLKIIKADCFDEYFGN